MWAVKADRVLAEWGWVENGVVWINDDRIEAIGAIGAAGVPTLEAVGCTAVPGFIDLHVHGGGGASVWSAEEEAVDETLRAHCRGGTTALLPTIYPAEPEAMEAQIRAIPAKRPGGGATAFGAHLEGPHLNPARMGGLAPRERLRPLESAELERLREASRVPLRLVTLAPEVRGALDLIRLCRRSGVSVALGHTTADYETTLAAIEAGATAATHVFNTFQFARNARDPRALEALLLDERVVPHLIADLAHVREPFIRLLLRLKGPERIALITDALAEAGTPEAPPVKLAADGRILGSTMLMIDAVRNLTRRMGLPLEDAVTMASRVPAAEMGLNKGRIAPGADADVTLLDADLRVRATIVEGTVAFCDGLDVPRGAPVERE